MENPFSPEIKDGNLFGRGSVDMKGPIAAMICAMKAIKDMGLTLSGDIVFAGVIDEEERSYGTVHLLKNMPNVDAAIIGEPTDFDICITHRGLEWLEIRIEGKTVHGGKQSEGLNAISMAARFLLYLEEKMAAYIAKSSHPLIGSGSYNLGTIKGGTQPSTVAGDCVITLDRRWLPGESHKEIMNQFEEIIESFKPQAPGYKFYMKILDSSIMESGYAHETMETVQDELIVKAVINAVESVLESSAKPDQSVGSPKEKQPKLHAYTAWTDGGLLSTYGKIPTVVFAPGNLESAHSAGEHINIDSMVKAVTIYAWIIYQFCK